MTKKYDFLIIGSGVAGMSYALKVAEAKKGKIAILCKTTLEEANTAKAQGGIASVTNLLVDNFEKHIEDTMIAGDWISDPEAVKQVVMGGPAGIKDLVRWGVNFDKKEDGTFDLHRENGHSQDTQRATPQPLNRCPRLRLADVPDSGRSMSRTSDKRLRRSLKRDLRQEQRVAYGKHKKWGQRKRCCPHF